MLVKLFLKNFLVVYTENPKWTVADVVSIFKVMVKQLICTAITVFQEFLAKLPVIYIETLSNHTSNYEIRNSIVLCTSTLKNLEFSTTIVDRKKVLKQAGVVHNIKSQ